MTSEDIMDPAQIAVLSGLVIGLVYGSIGLASGFCMMSRLRGWWAEGDARLLRTRALVLLGRGNLRSFVVVIVLGIFAEMTLKGLIAPARIVGVQLSTMTTKLI